MENWTRKKSLISVGIFVLIFVVLLLVLNFCTHDTSKPKPNPDGVGEEFKVNFAKWNDLKLAGDICDPKYLTELKEVKEEFSKVYQKAKPRWNDLSKKDRIVYEGYGNVSNQLGEMIEAIKKEDYSIALQRLDDIERTEKKIKQQINT